MNESEAKTCYSCVWNHDGGYGFCYCNLDDTANFFPSDIPVPSACEKYRRKSGITIKERYKDALPQLYSLAQLRGCSVDMIEWMLEQDKEVMKP